MKQKATIIPSFHSVLRLYLYDFLFLDLDPGFSWWLTPTDSFTCTPDGWIRTKGHFSPLGRAEMKGASTQMKEGSRFSLAELTELDPSPLSTLSYIQTLHNLLFIKICSILSKKTINIKDKNDALQKKKKEASRLKYQLRDPQPQKWTID